MNAKPRPLAAQLSDFTVSEEEASYHIISLDPSKTTTPYGISGLIL
jgi:hypothetical protein